MGRMCAACTALHALRKPRQQTRAVSKKITNAEALTEHRKASQEAFRAFPSETFNIARLLFIAMPDALLIVITSTLPHVGTLLREPTSERKGQGDWMGASGARGRACARGGERGEGCGAWVRRGWIFFCRYSLARRQERV
jgi:hypothetical protein